MPRCVAQMDKKVAENFTAAPPGWLHLVTRCAAEMPPLPTGSHHGSRFIVPDEFGNSALAMVCIGLDDIDV